MSISDSVENRVIERLESALGLQGSGLSVETALLGNLPEFDSQSVITVLTALEEEFDIIIEDDEVDASLFESVGSLVTFVTDKVSTAV